MQNIPFYSCTFGVLAFFVRFNGFSIKVLCEGKGAKLTWVDLVIFSLRVV